MILRGESDRLESLKVCRSDDDGKVDPLSHITYHRRSDKGAGAAVGAGCEIQDGSTSVVEGEG